MARRPSMDPELAMFLQGISFPKLSQLTPDAIRTMRKATASPTDTVEKLAVRGITHEKLQISAAGGNSHDIILSLLRPSTTDSQSRPCIYWIHGGGLHWGDRLHTIEFPASVVLECDAVCVSVEYRLAPEHPYPAALEDCYGGIKWISEHAQDLGIDANRIMVAGVSAGGGLAAATALLCRDRRGPRLCAQCLSCPMLDDRNLTRSSHQYVEEVWPREANVSAWKSYLGAHFSNLEISIYAAPGRADNLSGLPTTYLDAGSAEVFRDDVVAYASRLWADGVQAELHVWAGGFHGFEIFAPTAEISMTSMKAKMDWVKKIFSDTEK
ncbi:esterase LipW [Lipomyces orientalis]|uniref:Esterase LipW n=1 Tax=Lipomyces orientalis TaxID=1233043 RepID=A0ACC3TG36_9ASCO